MRADPAPRGSRRRAVLDLLRSSAQGQTVEQVATRLGERPTTVRFHLDALSTSGVVERTVAAAAGPGRPPVLYRATPHTLRGDGSGNYRLLASVLVDVLSNERSGADPALVAAGRRWGARLVDETGARDLTSLLDTLGFAPDPATVEGDVVLRHCPFYDVAEPHRDVVCPVHLGIMQGASAVLDPGVRVTDLVPFVTPDACVAHLGA